MRVESAPEKLPEVHSGNFVLKISSTAGRGSQDDAASNPDKRQITVSDTTGKIIFDSKKVAEIHARKLLKTNDDPDSADIRITETFSPESFVGPYLTMTQSVEIDAFNKEGGAVGAHPTNFSRYVCIDCRNPEDINQRDWDTGDTKSINTNEVLLQQLFPPNAVRDALLKSNDIMETASDVESEPKGIPLTKLIRKLERAFWPSQGNTQTHGLMNRFAFGKFNAKTNRVDVSIGVEQYRQEPQPNHISLPVPTPLRPFLLDAQSGKRGFVQGDPRLEKLAATHEAYRSSMKTRPRKNSISRRLAAGK